MAKLSLPLGVTIKVEAVGNEGRVILAPAGVAAEFHPLRRGCLSAILTFDPGCTSLDRAGAALIEAALAGGDPAFCLFDGGLKDALIFRATIS